MDEINNTKEKENTCHYYVKTALEQNTQNKNQQCHLTGSRWSDNKEGQYQWCMSVLERLSRAETDARNTALDNCIAKKTSPANKNNQPKIPADCQSNNPNKHAVKTLYRHFRYSKEIDEPIKNGLIRYDYNRDTKEDFLFLERHKQNANVILCLSQPQGYTRKEIGISFNAEGDSLDSFRYFITQDGNQLHLRIDYFGHNQGSSQRTLVYQFDVTQNKFIEQQNTVDTSPVFYDGEPYPVGVPDSPKMQ
ncbi:MAG TPA: hypothetical protein EYH35_00095 [Thiotrichaceae bacterium]|nr:hypothetical protein [Thiotrichaceae bacterium]